MNIFDRKVYILMCAYCILVIKKMNKENNNNNLEAKIKEQEQEISQLEDKLEEKIKECNEFKFNNLKNLSELEDIRKDMFEKNVLEKRGVVRILFDENKYSDCYKEFVNIKRFEREMNFLCNDLVDRVEVWTDRDTRKELSVACLNGRFYVLKSKF